MKRWHQERALMLRRWREEIANHEGLNVGAVPAIPPAPDERCHCYRGPGFMRKRTPYGCANPRCGLCHYGKLYVPKARAEKKRRAIEFDLAASR